MQLLPETAQGIADRTGGEGFVEVADLDEPEINVRYGAWYLEPPARASTAAGRTRTSSRWRPTTPARAPCDGWIASTPAGRAGAHPLRRDAGLSGARSSACAPHLPAGLRRRARVRLRAGPGDPESLPSPRPGESTELATDDTIDALTTAARRHSDARVEMMSVRPRQTCAPTRTVAEAARLMVDARVGSVLVVEGRPSQGHPHRAGRHAAGRRRRQLDVEVVGDHMTQPSWRCRPTPRRPTWPS